MGGFFRCLVAAGLGSVVCLTGGWSSSSSESDSLVWWAFRATLFFAVGGPRRGLLFFLRGCSSSSSCSSSKLVGRRCAAVHRSIVRDLLSADPWTYNWLGSSSGSSSRGLNGEGFVVCPLPRFPAGLFGDGGGGLAKSCRLERRLLGVVEDPDVPGVDSSSSSVSSWRRLLCSLCLGGVSVEAL